MPFRRKACVSEVCCNSCGQKRLNGSGHRTWMQIVAQKFCNRATKAFVALAHQMPSSFRNSWSRFTDSVLQRLIPRGVITEVVFTQSNHSRT